MTTDSTVAVKSKIFVLVLITGDDHIDLMRRKTADAFPILQLTSVIFCQYAAQICKSVHILYCLLTDIQRRYRLLTTYLHGLSLLSTDS